MFFLLIRNGKPTQTKQAYQVTYLGLSIFHTVRPVAQPEPSRGQGRHPSDPLPLSGPCTLLVASQALSPVGEPPQAGQRERESCHLAVDRPYKEGAGL